MLYVEGGKGASADFDTFSYRDGFTTIPARGPDDQFGTQVVDAPGGAVLGGLENGDWALYGSVDLGGVGVRAAGVELRVSSASAGGDVEIWLDPLAGGQRVATCPVGNTGGWDNFQAVTCGLSAAGTHEVYVKVTGGPGELVRLASLRFVPAPL